MTRLALWTVLLLLAVYEIGANVSMFGCERFSGVSLRRVDMVLGETCAASTDEGTDYSQSRTQIIDGRTLLLETDTDCCTLCRTTPGCKSWTRFVEAGIEDRPVGSCWLSSSLPLEAEEASPRSTVHSGIVSPAVLNPVTCLARRYIGYSEPHYNRPSLLKSQSEDACCLRCQEQNLICRGWSYDQRDQSCRLYSMAPENAYICRTCISGTIAPIGEVAADEVMQIVTESCGTGQTSGNEGIIYRGSEISVEGAFQSETSAGCCHLCAIIRECRSWTWLSETQACSLFDVLPSRRWRGQETDRSGVSVPKVCQPLECAVNEGVDLSAIENTQEVGSDSTSQNFEAASKEECCLRCQEIPNCRAWTYFNSKMLCWTISHPQLGIHSCSDCSSSILAFRYVFPEDRAILTRMTSEISTLLGVSSVPVTGDEAVEVFTGTEDQESKTDSISLGVVLGIVGAIVALLICVPVTWQLIGWRRHKRIQAGRKKIAKSSPSQSSFGVSGTSASPLGRPDTSRGDSLSDPALVEAQDLFAESSLSTNPDFQALSEKQTSVLHNLLQQSRQKQSYFQFRSKSSLKETEEDKLYGVLGLAEGTIVASKYKVEQGTRIGQNSAIVKAHLTFGQTIPVVIKFFKTREEFARESTFYSDSVSSNFLPDVLDIYDGGANEALGLPPLPCIVIERGDSSLEDWLGKQSRMLDQMDQRSILYKISRALQFLHERMVVHRDLKPGNIVVFALDFSLKLIDLGSACRKGESAAIEYTLRYAAPEVVSAHLANSSEIVAHPSADLWPLGLIFWEVLVGECLFGKAYTEEEVMAMLVGLSPFPFDKDPGLWDNIVNKSARRLVQGLLRRNPEARFSIQKVLSSAYFSTGTDTVAHEESLEAMGKQLQEIAQGVNTIRQGLVRLEELSVENLKMNAANALLACFSFIEIDPAEIDPGHEIVASFLVERFTRQQLKCKESMLEPHYNVFRRQSDEPISLLRIGRRHLIRVSLMTAGDTRITVPVAELLWIRIFPTDVEQDTIEADFSLTKNEGHMVEGVGFWNTNRHRDLSLKLPGKASINVVVGFKLKGHDAVTTIHKTLHVRMHSEKEQFRTLRAFNRSKALFASLPQWAKVYIHGSITIVKIAMG